MKYDLILENGSVTKESGHFFKALPFSLFYSHEKAPLYIDFTHGSMGKVVFKIIQNDTLIQECHHPDYVPEKQPGIFQPPESLTLPLQYAMSAFAYLHIIKAKSYLEKFHPITGELKLSFRVSQET